MHECMVSIAPATVEYKEGKAFFSFLYIVVGQGEFCAANSVSFFTTPPPHPPPLSANELVGLILGW